METEFITVSERFENPENYTRAPNEILRCDLLSLPERMLWLILYSYCFIGDTVWPSMARIAQDMNVSKKTVLKYRTGLEHKGFLIVIRRGQGKTNKYQLFVPVLKTASDQDNNMDSCLNKAPYSWKEDKFKEDKKNKTPSTKNYSSDKNKTYNKKQDENMLVGGKKLEKRLIEIGVNKIPIVIKKVKKHIPEKEEEILEILEKARTKNSPGGWAYYMLTENLSNYQIDNNSSFESENEKKIQEEIKYFAEEIERLVKKTGQPVPPEKLPEISEMVLKRLNKTKRVFINENGDYESNIFHWQFFKKEVP